MTQIAVDGTSTGEIGGAQIRAAMLGSPTHGLRVVRQARRTTPTDTDELALLCVREREWWVARRVSDELTVWAYAGDDEAWDGFDRLCAGDGWRESVAEPGEQLAS